MTIYEIAGRSKKAAALVAVLREHPETAHIARFLMADEWAEISIWANVKPPSATTIALVLERLAEIPAQQEADEADLYAKRREAEWEDTDLLNADAYHAPPRE